MTKNLFDLIACTTIPQEKQYTSTLDLAKAVRTCQKAYKVVKGEKPLKELADEYIEELKENSKPRNKKKLGDDLNISFIDNVFRDKVKPKIGSVVYCGLLLNQVEHSGIYIGYNKIAHLDGSGKIEAVSPEVFLERLNGLNWAISIYVSCKDGKPVGSRGVAERARRKIGRWLKYSVASNNCHMFTSGCLTGKFKNDDGFFCELEQTTERVLDANEWRVWDIPYKKKK
ncbi:lecithin retinol acyltransferase family protein [Acinetobacter sp. C_4_1]|uniref:lecithin retinol acyltransferase family protein n=1 Tax=unclassified Acinetobacter TaxID=196816 RepID=UPI0021B82378|nr:MULTISPECIES: lecithin retinol acyltransferase family protein [unclassified Acinetobacter]MCT8088795.1 lecithin retinol acyltransferase family protein [Acinetobacter sp. F_3_1]MCT8096951.1 lecithin retinol acyltransferase family protein [Acinetobacter sp. C_3_1]MCT8100056.1 lecithin retinol acyltransferase family protein [Acinetobacter sp. C_4_1]MCT8134454.1 lecithin retinol acyltransferase family protein [Acinetobacter sp. T_3_1]